MFYPELPSWQRYVVSTAIHIITGTSLLSGFIMVYTLITLIAVGLLGSEPRNWPPVMDGPWTADSMHIFWARRWHQFLRRTFVVYGGYPGKWLTESAARCFTGGKNTRTVTTVGETGSVFGVFLASGLFHELSIYSMNRGFRLAPIVFFVAQAFVLLGERVWRTVTGRRVGGRWGIMWVWTIMFVAAQPMSECLFSNRAEKGC